MFSSSATICEARETCSTLSTSQVQQLKVVIIVGSTGCDSALGEASW